MLMVLACGVWWLYMSVMTENEIANWLDGFARDMVDFGADDGSAEKLKLAAAIIRKYQPRAKPNLHYLRVIEGNAGSK